MAISGTGLPQKKSQRWDFMVCLRFELRASLSGCARLRVSGFRVQGAESNCLLTSDFCSPSATLLLPFPIPRLQVVFSNRAILDPSSYTANGVACHPKH